ncbi:MAG: acyl-CoA dehydrogenase family protein [Gammaproteobacteria bacterium]|nr:acyl-CoA dehydrogenase family protein [Gammaproteobacteria bacterium]
MILNHRDDFSALRSALRAWLADTLPSDWFEHMVGATEEDSLQFQRDWFSSLESEGLATAHWPTRWGGVNLSLSAQSIIYEELARVNAPMIPAYVISLYHLPATLAEFGTPEQRDRYLPAVRNEGVIWCQGFSEPGAGSDLASLKTQAVRDGDHYVVNGQKVWSSYAHGAKHCLLLVRTSNEGSKHAGITYLIVDMDTPGIDVRPIVQADGARLDFAEVFYEDVRVPVENLIGEENQGWQIAQTTLAAERGVIILEKALRWRVQLKTMLHQAQQSNGYWLQDAQLRREYARLMGKMEGVVTLARRVISENERGELRSVTPAYTKILCSELAQEIHSWRARTAGIEAQLVAPKNHLVEITNHPMSDYLRSWALTISGGSNEIMRNLIAQRDLGMPKR